jgi:cell division protein ZapA (FtsZ GTPase activity inhibitor)
MSKPLTISVDNKSYNVIGENEELMQKATELLNAKIQEITTNIGNVPSLTKTTLAALNIAEMEISNENNYSENLKNITTEINKITEFIDANVENVNYN